MARKYIFTLSISAIMLCLIAAPSFADRHGQKKIPQAMPYRSHHKEVLHMYPTDANGNWTLTRNAPKGELKYNLWGKMFNFSFKGIKLAPGTSYTLVYYKENDSYLPSFLVLGGGLTDRHGHIYFENTLETCSMPASDDVISEYGARILLVPSYALDEENGLIDLDRDADLEGSHLIRFFDTDGCSLQDPVDEDSVNDDDPVVQDPPDEDTDTPVDPPPNVFY